jgi:hypothetical protein
MTNRELQNKTIQLALITSLLEVSVEDKIAMLEEILGWLRRGEELSEILELEILLTRSL